MNELHHFLRTRRSIRRFKPDPVPASVMDRILHTATFAPSAHNLQPWRFVRVESSSAKEMLGVALTSKMRADSEAKGADQAEAEKRVQISLRRIDEAPVILLLCRDETAIKKDEPEETIMGIHTLAVAGLQLLLAAHAEGLGGNWICWSLYAQETTQKALNLPETWLPEILFFLGYADETPQKAVRQPLENLLKIV